MINSETKSNEVSLHTFQVPNKSEKPKTPKPISRTNSNQLFNNYETISNDNNSVYVINTSNPSTEEYGIGSIDQNIYLEANNSSIEKNVYRIRSLGGNTNSAYVSTASLISTSEEYAAKKHIVLGSENYVISIQPVKTKINKTITFEENDETKRRAEISDTATQCSEASEVVTVNYSNDMAKVSFFCFFCKWMFKIFCCCFRVFNCCGSFWTPCFCATAFGAIAAALGVVVMGFVGIIPLPIGMTNTLCNAVNQSKVFVTYENVTIIERNHVQINTTRLMDITPTLSNLTTSTKTTTTTSVINVKKIQENFIDESMKNSMECNNAFGYTGLDWIPIYYNILLLPNILPNEISEFELYEEAEKTVTREMDLKLSLDIHFTCNSSVNIIQLGTKEFTNLNITIDSDKDKAIKVNSWNFERSRNALAINLNRNCTEKTNYNLNVFIQYKNYGSITDIKTKKPHNFFVMGFSKGYDAIFPFFLNRYLTPVTLPSTFNLTVVKLPSSYSPIFNMNEAINYEKNGLQFTHYKLTPFIPVDSLAVILGKFKCEDKYFNQLLKIRIRLCATRQLLDQMLTVVRYTSLILEYNKNVTRKSYPLNKLDILILPIDENHQLIQQNNNQIGIIFVPYNLVNRIIEQDGLKSAQIMSKIILIISKQLAKHWFFGILDCSCSIWDNTNTSNNLIDPFKAMLTYINDTMYFRSNSSFFSASYFLDYNQNCFLKKGIINWLSYLSIEYLQPELYDLVDYDWYMIRKNEAQTYSMDQNQNYDDSNFAKIASSNNLIKTKIELKSLVIIRTLQQIFGPQKFQLILSKWSKQSDLTFPESLNNLTEINYSNLDKQPKIFDNIAYVFDLFSNQYNILENKENSMRDLIFNWILSENDVLVNVNRNYNKRQATIEVKSKNMFNNLFYPFFWSITEMKSLGSGNLIIESEKNKINILWLKNGITNLNDSPGADNAFIGNYMRAFGLFRTNYDIQNWIIIMEQLKRNLNALSLEDRIQFIDDAFYLSSNGKLSISIAMELLEYLPTERSYLPWKIAIDNLKSLIVYIQDDSSIYTIFREHTINLFNSTYQRLKWGDIPKESIDDKLIRIMVVDLMCYLDFEDCVANSVKQLSDLKTLGMNNIPLHLRKSVYCTALRYTGINEWQYLWQLYASQSPTSQEAVTLIQSLSCSSQTWILNMLLRKLLYENYVPRSELPAAFEHISQNPMGKYVVWNHISQNYQTFYNKIGNDPDLFVRIVEVSTKYFKFKYEIKQVYDFIQTIGIKNNSNYDEKNILEKIESRINSYTNWNKWNSKVLTDWLVKRLRKSSNFNK